MRITYGHMAMFARGGLSRDFTKLNETTNNLLAEVGIRRAASPTHNSNLGALVTAEGSAISSGIAEAANLTVRNDTADTALSSIADDLSSMRDLAQEVALGDLTAEEIETKAAEYEALAEDVQTALDETSYEGRQLLDGRDPLVTLNLDSVLEMDLTDMPEDGVDLVTSAVVQVGEARAGLDLDTEALSVTSGRLTDHLSDVSAYGERLTSTSAALSVVASVTDQFMRDVVGATSTQANVSGLKAWQLLEESD